MSMTNRIDQSLFTKKINIRQMLDMVKLCKSIGKTAFFMGGAGLGKSQKMQQIADYLYPHMKNHVQGNLCDVRLSDKEPQDIAGIQIPIEYKDEKTGEIITRTVYATPNFWPTDPNWEGIVFLDELPNAGLSTQHSAYQVVLDHMAGTFKFPKGAIFVGAGNRDTDNAGTTEMPGPLVNRMMIMEVEYDLDVWIEDFAIPFRIHPHVVGFLKQFPQYFYTGDLDDRKNFVFASPRQWESVSKVLYQYEKSGLSDYLTEVAIQGLVGDGMDSLLMSYHVRAKKLPPLDKIFDGTAGEHKLGQEDIDLVYVLVQGCLMKMEDYVMDDKLTDDEVVEKVGNFLTFMNTNHSRTSKEIVMALLINIFRDPVGGKAILRRNDKRSSLLPKLRSQSTAVMSIVMEYTTRYSDILMDM